MRKSSQLYLLLVSFLLAVFLISFASAGLVNPATSSTIGGTAVLLNATNATFSNMTNCTFYAGSTLTANTTWTLVGYIANETENPKTINMTFNSKILEDANDYQFNATCYNRTNGVQSTTLTGITVDNTIPQAPTLTTPVQGDSKSNTTDLNFQGTVIDGNTTSCTFTMQPIGGTPTSRTGTYSTNTCTFLWNGFNQSSDSGHYLWYMTASDETNTTASSSNDFYVSISPSNGGIGGGNVVVQTDSTGKKTLAVAGSGSGLGSNGLGLIIILGLVIGLVYYWSKK